MLDFLGGLLGGLGVFLLGMLLLTDGLKALAGPAMRGVLRRWVRGPISGLGWGALATAVVQSSSATTLATIGLVSAGLLTFTQSLGVIMGANLGTTSTGWIVSQLGLKVSLGAIAPLIVFVGVLGRLLAKGRWVPLAHVGAAVAGFGLLFLGIGLLQTGMADLAAGLTEGPHARAWPAFLRDGSFVGRLVLVALGVAMTLVTMSSSAAMAATLAAVAGGAIDPATAAALVIGQNIGTSPKAIAASVGAGAAAKRTALAHLLFNLVAGTIALAFMGPLLGLCQWFARAVGSGDGPTALAAFHTVFNVLGVAVLLPLARPFARMVERMIPERGPAATRYLSPAVAQVGPVALEAARRGLFAVLVDALALASRRLEHARQPQAARLHGLAGRARGGPPLVLTEGTQAVTQVRAFVHGLGRAEQAGPEVARQVALMHAADHLDHAIGLLEGPGLSRAEGDVARAHELLARGLREALGPQADEAAPNPELVGSTEAAAALAPTAQALAQAHKGGRLRALARTARGRLSPREGERAIDALSALERLSMNLARAAYYLTDPPPTLDDAALGMDAGEANAQAREHPA